MKLWTAGLLTLVLMMAAILLLSCALQQKQDLSQKADPVTSRPTSQPSADQQVVAQQQGGVNVVAPIQHTSYTNIDRVLIFGMLGLAMLERLIRSRTRLKEDLTAKVGAILQHFGIELPYKKP